ncbi:NACHT, LRR and PYD domains-containing protein 1 homolog isoform X3 [Carassius carassius]|uniref:NACHT, LRR and PYD domains-containing protein 1 homolog isoform X3 n=1 Tax=Carassius carassius TaxID=217509 RepID=UPI002868BFA1|nr:NACHT, LRR and PYD domains-containing protein 1 homolog isoform X3 [Carassius carassius]
MDVSDNEDKRGTVEPHDAVSKISITAQNGSIISAPVIQNSTVTGNINIAHNYFTGPESEVTDTSTLITEYKKSVLSDYVYITEYTSHASEHVLLNDRYTDPLIIQKHRGKKERENEMCSRGERFFSTRETNQRNQNIRLDQLFSPVNGSKIVTRKAVILQGDSGSGKSITAQKIILDWASGELYAGLFDVVFHLRCKELNGLSGEVSLLDLLDCSLAPKEIAQILKDIPQRILFIIDGFDELMLSGNKELLPPKPDIKSHSQAIVCSLLKGRMMRESFLLVTTRSTSVDKLEIVLKKPQCFVEIMGFSEKGVSEYFRKFFEDEEFSSQVYEQVKIHEMLYTACFVPVICWIVCTIFKRKGKDGVATSELTTTTSIFVDFVLTLLKHHSSLNPHDELNLLKNLGQLAESGTPKRQVLFSRNNLPKAISDLPNIPFLCKFHQQERIYIKEMFGFLHLSFQEFFTALFYMLTDKAEVKIKVRELLELAGNGRHNKQLLPVIRFLFGLSNKKVSRLIPGEHTKSTSTVIRTELEIWISKVIEKNIMDTYYMSDFILHCLYELHDRNILKNVMKLWERSGINIHWSLKGVDSHVVMYCLQYSSRIITMEVKSNAKDLKMLHPVLCRCTNLWLDFDSISDADVNLLTSALGRRKNVGYLTMEDGALSDESVQKILKTLSGQTSVGNIQLVMRNISNTSVDLTMDFLVKEMTERKFSVCIASQAENMDKSLCSEFTIARKNDSFKFTVGHSNGHQGEISGEPGLCFYQGFSKISFGLCPFSAIPMTDLLKTSQNLRSFSDMKNTEFDVNVDALLSFLSHVPGLTEVDIQAEYLTDIWTSKILSYLQVNPKISHVKFHLSNLMISDEERVCSTFSVSRKPFEEFKMHDSEEKNPSLILAMDRWAYDIASGSSGELVHPHRLDKPALVKLILSFPPLKGSSASWEVLFKRLYQLIQLTEQCPELDEHMDSLLLFLHSVPGLKEVKVWLNNLIESWAAGLFTLFLSCSSLLHLQLNTSMSIVSDVESLGIMRDDGVRAQSTGEISDDSDEDCMSPPLSDCSDEINQSDSYELDGVERVVCSDLRMWRRLSGQCRMSLKCTSSSPRTKSLFSEIELILSENSEKTSSDWKNFLKAYIQCKGISIISPTFEESVDALLLSLHSVSALNEVRLTTDRLTENLAVKIFSMCHTAPSLHNICLQVEYSNTHSELSVCSSLNITRNTDSTLTVDIQLASDSMIETSPSFISFISPCSEISKLDGQELFETLDILKGLEDGCEEHEELVGDLMSTLLSVSGLQKVRLKISSLTENWMKKCLFLTEVCPSLQEIRFDCIESGGLLLEEVERILQSSQMDTDCRIIITGMKRSKAMNGCTAVMMDTSRSSSACDQKVKVSFFKDSLTRRFTIDKIETEDTNDDDPEDEDIIFYY